MYNREQASLLRQRFWTALGQYLALHPSAEGLKINWVNYKTGFKHVYFAMDADNHHARISIELRHPDVGIQEIYWEQLLEFKMLLQQIVGEEWTWEPNISDKEGRIISRVGIQLSDVSVFVEEHWPKMIGFFTPRLIALDEFWCDAKFTFQALKD